VAGLGTDRTTGQRESSPAARYTDSFFHQGEEAEICQHHSALLQYSIYSTESASVSKWPWWCFFWKEFTLQKELL